MIYEEGNDVDDEDVYEDEDEDDRNEGRQR